MTDQPPKGDRMIPFTCLAASCPSSCCGPFHGTKAVVAVMSKSDLGEAMEPDDVSLNRVSIFAQIRLTETDIDRLRSAGLDRMMVYRTGPDSSHRLYLKLNEDGSCAALAANGRCSIHPSRPTICRAFPFYFDLFAGLSMVEACPGVGGEPQKVADLQEEIRAATDMYRFWLEEIQPTIA